MANPLPPPDFFSSPYTYVYQAQGILAGVPMAVGAIIVLTALGTWGLFYFLHRKQLSDLGERVKLRDDQIAELRRQLSFTPTSSGETFVIEAREQKFFWVGQDGEPVPNHPDIPKPPGAIPQVEIRAVVTAVPARTINMIELEILRKRIVPVARTWEPFIVDYISAFRYCYFDLPAPPPGSYSAKLIALSGDVEKASAPFALVIPR